MRFARLGLLVIDEEQHFGVAHKERLKPLREDVHVLTLTATPIPRTLQLALSGVRELSLIATPPVDRLAIRTYVSEFDPVTMREALLRERYRGGQSLLRRAAHRRPRRGRGVPARAVPEVSFVVAHGQMAAGELDDRMNAFYDGKYDVLLSDDDRGIRPRHPRRQHADRGPGRHVRPGAALPDPRPRRPVEAARLCLLHDRAGKKLTPQAEKRLRVLGALDSLGAGFTLASQDLDIRGAGNLLGEEQSGQVREVGFELYQEMLEEAIAHARGEVEMSDDGNGRRRSTSACRC